MYVYFAVGLKKSTLCNCTLLCSILACKQTNTERNFLVLNSCCYNLNTCLKLLLCYSLCFGGDIHRFFRKAFTNPEASEFVGYLLFILKV